MGINLFPTLDSDTIFHIFPSGPLPFLHLSDTSLQFLELTQSVSPIILAPF